MTRALVAVCLILLAAAWFATPVPMPDDRPEPEDRADGDWLEPYDEDAAAERHRLRHTGRLDSDDGRYER